MEEAKKIFQGNIFSKLIFVFSALGLVGLLVGSIFFGGGDVSGVTDYLHLPTKLFGIDSILPCSRSRDCCNFVKPAQGSVHEESR